MFLSFRSYFQLAPRVFNSAKHRRGVHFFCLKYFVKVSYVYCGRKPRQTSAFPKMYTGEIVEKSRRDPCGCRASRATCENAHNFICICAVVKKYRHAKLDVICAYQKSPRYYTSADSSSSVVPRKRASCIQQKWNNWQLWNFLVARIFR